MLNQQPTHQDSSRQALSGQSSVRPVFLYAAVCFVGALVVSLVAWLGISLIGIPIIAYATAVLKCRKKTWVALVAIAAGAGACIFIDVSTSATVLLLGLITVVTTMLVMGRFGQAKYFVTVLVFTVILFAVDAIGMYIVGMTIQGGIEATVNEIIKMLTVDGTVPAETISTMKSLLTTVASLWPSLYFVEGTLCTALAVFAARAAYRKHDAGYNQPHFDMTDMSVHIVWVLIAGLLCWAASYLEFSYAVTAKVVGLNLLVCSAVLFMIQGFAVISFWMNRAHLNMVLQVIIILLAIQMEIMFLIPTFIGVIDFWANFRKLPREEQATGSENDAGLTKG